MLLVIAPRVYGGHDISHYMGNVVPFGGHALGIAFAADPLGMTFALAAAAIGALLLLFTLSSLRELAPRELGGYACLFQLLLAALIGSALTADLFNLFVWFEVAALSSYGLTGFFLERPIALEAAFKVLVLTTLASFFIFIGASLLYADHGALNFAQLHRALAGGASTTDMVALDAAAVRVRDQGGTGAVPRLAARRAHRRARAGVGAVLRADGQPRHRRDRPHRPADLWPGRRVAGARRCCSSPG